MPVLQMKSNHNFTSETKTDFLKDMTQITADILGKPYPAVMPMLSQESMMMNGNDTDEVFFLEIRFVDSSSTKEESEAVLKKLSDEYLNTITKYTGVSPYCVYIQFTKMAKEDIWRYIPDK